ncbi:hypothetical protein [Burkholderia gladioli]|uniref:hypothetical protein n=1 Tax=Burkholderia gladioli TaxID=28095 RepID=UPI00163F5186|nr:hypothetical protein [Burkholderia gladioli]
MSETNVTLETVAAFEQAAGKFAWAADTLEQLEALFAAIESGSPADRRSALAELGRTVSSTRSAEFNDLCVEFNCKADDLRALVESRAEG